MVLPSISKIKDDELIAFSKVIRLPIYDIRKSFGSILLYFPSLFISGWKLRSAMKKDKCQNLQVNDYYMMQGVIARLFGYRGKIVTWVRIDPTRYGSFFSKYWLKYCYWASDNVVAVSKFILTKIPRSNKNRLVYDPVREDFNCIVKVNDQKTRKLIYISNYTEGKGHQHAVDAFEKIASEFPDIELHFYGGTIDFEKNMLYKKSLKDLAKNTPYSNRIFFHDFVQDTRKVLQEAYMSLNFSESESFSMTCLEASSLGVSVVATQSGGPEEIIVDGRTGYLIERGDIGAMANSIRKLLVNGDRNREFGENGALYVRKNFSPRYLK